MDEAIQLRPYVQMIPRTSIHQRVCGVEAFSFRARCARHPIKYIVRVTKLVRCVASTDVMLWSMSAVNNTLGDASLLCCL